MEILRPRRHNFESRGLTETHNTFYDQLRYYGISKIVGEDPRTTKLAPDQTLKFLVLMERGHYLEVVHCQTILISLLGTIFQPRIIYS